MNRIRVFCARLIGMFRLQRNERQLDDELEFHLQTEIDHQIESGLTPEEARQVARKKLGPVLQVKEAYREIRGITVVETFVRDIRYALRGLARSPGFAVTATLSLALGIGGTTAVFTLMDPLVLQPLPVLDPDRLVSFEADRMNLRVFLPDFPEEAIRQLSERSPVSYAEFDQLTARSDLFSGTFDYVSASSNFSLRIAGEQPSAETRVVVGQASGGFFATLGVRTSIGRPFLESDLAPGQPSVVVISDSFWKNRFGGSPDVIGTTVTLIQSPEITRLETEATIVGVAVPGFDGIEPGTAVDLWKPSGRARGREASPVGPRGIPAFGGAYAVARLRPGVDLDHAQARIDTIYRQVLSEWIGEYGSGWTDAQKAAFLGQRMNLRSASKGWTLVWNRVGQPLKVLMASVSCLLLIACANVGALLLARGEVRRPELALRMAMGGGRFRLIRQLVTESLTLAAVGVTAGLATAWLAVRILLAYAPEGSSIAESVGLDGRSLAFTTIAGLLSVAVFGLIPAIRTTRLGLNPGKGGSTEDFSRPAVRGMVGRLFISGQLALSLILLVGAGLFVETLQNLRQTETGFDRQQVVRFVLNRTTPPSRELLDRIQGLPDVDSASVSNDIGLLGGHAAELPVQADGDVASMGGSLTAVPTLVGFRFFETMGIRLLAGRTFRPDDAQRSGDVALISETMARSLFGEGNPVGRHFFTDAPQFITGRSRGDGPEEVEILGVVEDVVSRSLRERPRASVYFPMPFNAAPDQYSFVIRTTLDLGDIARAVRNVVTMTDPDIRIARIQTMDGIVEDTIARERFLAQLATVFGILALALTSIGLYGTLSFAVAQRTREIGIRMALGARIRDAMAHVMHQAAWAVGLGLVLGLGGALVATRAISTLLFGVAPTEPRVIAGAVLLLTAAAVIAAYLPTRRASRVDPLVALRHE